MKYIDISSIIHCKKLIQEKNGYHHLRKLESKTKKIEGRRGGWCPFKRHPLKGTQQDQANQEASSPSAHPLYKHLHWKLCM